MCAIYDNFWRYHFTASRYVATEKHANLIRQTASSWFRLGTVNYQPTTLSARLTGRVFSANHHDIPLDTLEHVTPRNECWSLLKKFFPNDLSKDNFITNRIEIQKLRRYFLETQGSVAILWIKTPKSSRSWDKATFWQNRTGTRHDLFLKRHRLIQRSPESSENAKARAGWEN